MEYIHEQLRKVGTPGPQVIGIGVLMIRADLLFKRLLQSRVGHFFDKALLRLLRPPLLMVDDFGLQKLSSEQACDLYEIVIERYGISPIIMTSCRYVEEWMDQFEDPLVANSILDCLTRNAHQIFFEGESYRKNRNLKTPREGRGV